MMMVMVVPIKENSNIFWRGLLVLHQQSLGIVSL